MPHVMVPCPEEHVEEVMANLMRLMMGMGGWDDESVATFVAELEPQALTLVEAVARLAVKDGRLPYRDAARQLGIDLGAVLELVTDINERCRRASWPLPLITQTWSEVTASGDARATPVLVIVRPVAERILACVDAAATAPDEGG